MKVKLLNWTVLLITAVAEWVVVGLPVTRLAGQIIPNIIAPPARLPAPGVIYLPFWTDAVQLGRFIGLFLCILGFGLAFTSRYGGTVSRSRRVWFATLFWIVPCVSFLAASYGHYAVESIMYEHAGFSIRTFPHGFDYDYFRLRSWLQATVLMTAPLIVWGRGIYRSAYDLGRFVWSLLRTIIHAVVHFADPADSMISCDGQRPPE